MVIVIDALDSCSLFPYRARLDDSRVSRPSSSDIFEKDELRLSHPSVDFILKAE